MRVSLTPALKREAARSDAFPLLDPVGPQVSLGGTCGDDRLAIPVVPSAATLFGPRGACLGSPGGPLWVCDTGHHRLLGWTRIPLSDGAPADWIIGQPDFHYEGRNAKNTPGPATLNVPTGICLCGAGLAVADAWNHRVLIWRELPTQSHTPADIVLGHSGFESVEANRGGQTPDADTLFWPYGVHWDGERLWVADSGNRRVLMWHGLPDHTGQAADLVFGQSGMCWRDENGGGDPSAMSMRWPHGIVLWDGRLCVADAGNNRIMVWDTVPDQNNKSCDYVLGQQDFVQVDHNQSLYWPGAATLNMPYGISAAGEWLLVADTANSRLLGWRADDCASGAAARALTGQADFMAKGDNRWQLPARDSLCWPYAVSACGETVVVSDSGNNRVMLWRLNEGMRA
ncbi:MAG: hypothetical protein HY028_03355 [Gammaproteobacteria bacterium]|nr:hypothetical protein [Gammaproteobacteria bacterium]